MQDPFFTGYHIILSSCLSRIENRAGEAAREEV